jgi:pyruvate dehydrogenase E2 component (dihydrolipoamide acetyltransferase)
VALHESLNSSANGAPGIRITITDLLLNAFARALKSNPELNATWQENEIRNRASVELGLAVATAKGVVAPVIRNADADDLRALAARRAVLVEKARAGRLALADMEGGVGTLSNLGMYRVDHFQAVINPGQSSILAVGQIRQRPWVEKTLSVKRTMMLNLTVDHRVADGAVAAVCLDKIIELIENPRDLAGVMQSSSGDRAERRLNG